MHMYWLMFIGVEVEYKSEVFVYLGHIVVIISRCKDTHNYSSGKINVAILTTAYAPTAQKSSILGIAGVWECR